MALTTPFFRVKMQQINHYTIAKKQDCILFVCVDSQAFFMQDPIAKMSAIRCIVFTVWFIVF